MDRQPPKWWTEGVPLLKMKDHLDERVKEMTKTPTPTGSGPGQR
jgi:hypothetical protein